MAKDATLPPRRRKNPKLDGWIEDMAPGDVRWVPPSAMYVDSTWRCWLYEGYAIDDTLPGWGLLRIERVSGGFIVDLSRCDGRRWLPGEEMLSPRVLPVVQVIDDPPADGV